MSSDPTLTSSAIWYLPQLFGSQWGSLVASAGKLITVPGNRFTTVPKTSLVDRGIAVEPSVNVFFQLGLGRVLRKRLLTNAGWDLDHAQDVHRQVACKASRTREYCTLDLSSASDTVCSNLVKLLMPHQWFEALDDLRSKKTEVDGRWVVLEKFSSMGNGYTFELETIIFAALACITARWNGHEGVLGKDVFVFGDDIIVKDDLFSRLSAVLQFFGFLLNKEKSFFGEAPFRESCGGDYWDGLDVRPVFLKELPSEPRDYIVLANQISLLRERLAPHGVDLDRKCWFSVLDCIPSRLRSLRGPKGLGDSVIWDREESWTVRFKDSIRYVRGLKSRPDIASLVKYGNIHPDIVLACATYGAGGGVVGGLYPRDAPSSFSVEWMPYS